MRARAERMALAVAYALPASNRSRKKLERRRGVRGREGIRWDSWGCCWIRSSFMRFHHLCKCLADEVYVVIVLGLTCCVANAWMAGIGCVVSNCCICWSRVDWVLVVV